MASDLDCLFSPRSIAVAGASRDEDAVGHAIFRNILHSGYQGKVHPVNPSADEILGHTAYDTVGAIDPEVDLAVVAVPEPAVEEVITQCAEKGAGACVIISAGFSEAGEAGRRARDRLRAIAAGSSMRLMGPNCLGVINTEPGVSLNATFAEASTSAGHVSVLSQRGAVGVYALEYARERGMANAEVVSADHRFTRQRPRC